MIAELIGVPERVVDDLKGWSDGLATSASTGKDIYGEAVFLSLRVARPASTGTGRTIWPGDRAFLCHLAANHDPAVFAHPERFDIRRPDVVTLRGPKALRLAAG